MNFVTLQRDNFMGKRENIYIFQTYIEHKHKLCYTRRLHDLSKCLQNQQNLANFINKKNHYCIKTTDRLTETQTNKTKRMNE